MTGLTLQLVLGTLALALLIAALSIATIAFTMYAQNRKLYRDDQSRLKKNLPKSGDHHGSTRP